MEEDGDLPDLIEFCPDLERGCHARTGEMKRYMVTSGNDEKRVRGQVHNLGI